jgi:hypothetical protein
MKSRLIVLFILVLMQWPAQGYPISPRPLRLLIEESEFIVWAHVRDIRTVKERGKKYTFENTVAVLTVYEVLQGTLTAVEIEIPYPAGLICPAPPHFEKGTDVLVFLDRAKGVYSVHALSYGVKELQGGEIAIYKARIAEMQQIMNIEDRDKKFLSTTEWLVKCAEERVTRHEGTYELSRGSDFMSYYDRNEGQPFQHALSDEQRVRLKSALLSSSGLSYADLGLIDLVYTTDAEGVCKDMLVKLKAFQENQLWYASEFMARINHYKSSPRTLELTETFEAKRFADEFKAAQLKALLDEYLMEAGKLLE